MARPQLTLLRHGQSVWNQQNKFTGWADVGLSDRGVDEARAAAAKAAAAGIRIDQVFTSALQRAIKTAWVLLEELNLMWVPQRCDWRLNERHYGALQGQNKADAARQYGEEQVQLWRRSFALAPPLAAAEQTPRYAGVAVPRGESLQAVVPRVSAVYEECILPCLQAEQNVLVVAHGNSLRALIKTLQDISDSDITKIEIKTGELIRYDFNAGDNPAFTRLNS